MDRPTLAVLVREYLLDGHLIDRAGMPHLIGAFGRDVMRDIAIDEWMGASPVYSKRMQRALGFEGDSVETIFKNLQLDIGAPPQFMDFRFELTDHDHGGFWLDHCGALMDVEPMGPDYVQAMCHDIEDPTFDATATASNPRAQMRPVHRPPRVPADRAPHCEWTVIIDPSPSRPAGADARRWPSGRPGRPRSSSTPSTPTIPGPTTTPGRSLADLRTRGLVGLGAPADRRRGVPAGPPPGAVLPGRQPGAGRLRRRGPRLLRHQFTGVAGVAATRLRTRPRPRLGTRGRRPGADPQPGTPPRPPTRGSGSSRGTACSSAWTGRRRRRPTGRGRPSWTPATSSPSMPSSAPSTAGSAARWCPRTTPSWSSRSSGARRSDPVPDDVRLTEFSTGADFAFVDRGTPVVLGRRGGG